MVRIFSKQDEWSVNGKTLNFKVKLGNKIAFKKRIYGPKGPLYRTVMSIRSMNKIRISTDKNELDRELIFNFLHNEARWCKRIPRNIVEKSIKNSLCFGAFIGTQQVGFARMVTDYATFGNLVDVFVIEELRGNGISRVILNAVNDHPELQGLRRITLATSDKQELYAKFGFKELARPEIFMERFEPSVYS